VSNKYRVSRNMLVAVIGTVICLAILSTCVALTYGRAKYVDVTHAPEYAGILGKRYTFAIPMPACGITMDRNYKPPADHVVILAPPGFSGPEVLWCEDLPEGTAFRVVGVKRCTNCLVDLEGREDTVMVDITPGRGYRGLPAELHSDDVLSKDESGRLRLNFQYYAPR
jgi:hypothetical protein